MSICSPQWGEQRTKQKTLYVSRLRKICHLKIKSQFQIHLPCWWQNLSTRVGKRVVIPSWAPEGMTTGAGDATKFTQDGFVWGHPVLIYFKKGKQSKSPGDNAP